MDLNETFAPAVSDWRQSPEAQELLRLRAGHRHAARRRADLEAEIVGLDRRQRQASAAGHPLELGPLAGRLNEARGEHARAVADERQAQSTADTGDAFRKARAALLNRLRVAAAQAAPRVGQGGGLPWAAAAQLTGPALAVRADQVLASLQPEDRHE
jgi:hypothetical protein